MWRNLLAVILGLAVGLGIVTLGIIFNDNWVEYEGNWPFSHWRYVVKAANHENREQLFLILLIFSGLGSLVGGVLTATIVKNAKVAYAISIGFLLFIIAYLDVIFTPYHPTWYELAIMPVLFFFSWLGGKITSLIYRKFKG